MPGEHSYTDAALVQALKHPAQADDAIRYIFRNFAPLIEHYVLTNKGNEDDAADIIQEAVVVLIETVKDEKYRGEAALRSFLFSIARNLWLTELRKRNSAANRHRLFEKRREGTEQGAEEQLVKHEHFKLVQQLFEKLGNKCRQLLMLVYYDDLPMSEIAALMPDYQNEQVLRNKKYKCMKQLENLMQANELLKASLKNALKYAR